MQLSKKNNADSQNSGQPPEPFETVGSYLKNERLKRKVSIHELYEGTGILGTAIEAIEADDRENLPADVFVRGFIKLYTRHLGINTQKALDLYQRDSAPATDTVRGISSTGQVIAREPGPHLSFAKVRKSFIIPAVVLFIVLGYLILQTLPVFQSLSLKNDISSPVTPSSDEVQFPESEQIAPDEQKETPPSLSSETLGEQTETTRSAPQRQPEITDDTIPSPEEHREPLPEQPEETLQDDSSNKPAHDDSARDTNQKSATESNLTTKDSSVIPPIEKTEEKVIVRPFKYTLKAHFQEMTWMTIQIDDQEPAEAFFMKGSRRIWKAEEKFNLHIGNAGGVILHLNDKKVALPEKSGQVIKLNLPN